MAARARLASDLPCARPRGVQLGGWRGGPKIEARVGTEALQQRADAFAASVAPITRDLQQQGKSLRQIAAEMTARGIRTPRGGAWTAAAVRSVLLRVTPAA